MKEDLKVGIQQRLLPGYRAEFFDTLGKVTEWRVEVFAGEPAANEYVRQLPRPLGHAQWVRAKNKHFLGGKSYFCWQSGFKRWLEVFKPDVLVVEGNPRILSTYLGIRMMRNLRRPVIAWGLGRLQWDVPRIMNLLRLNLLRKYYPLFNAIIAYSSKAANDYKVTGVPEERIFIAKNAVFDRYAKEFTNGTQRYHKKLHAWKNGKGITGKKPIILYVGRLQKRKKLDNLIVACTKLTTPCQLVFVGAGSARHEYENMAHGLRVDAVFTGDLYGEELSFPFACADLFVLPGTGGLSVQQAMSYGKAVIVADGDGTQFDLVRQGRNGFLVRPHSIEDLREAISNCIGNPNLLKEMGLESRRIVENEINLDKMVESFFEAITFVSESPL